MDSGFLNSVLWNLVHSNPPGVVYYIMVTLVYIKNSAWIQLLLRTCPLTSILQAQFDLLLKIPSRSMYTWLNEQSNNKESASGNSTFYPHLMHTVLGCSCKRCSYVVGCYWSIVQQYCHILDMNLNNFEIHKVLVTQKFQTLHFAFK